MTTGSAWHIYEDDDPTKLLLKNPWMDFDPDNVEDIPWDWTVVLAETAAVIANQTEAFVASTLPNPLTVVSSTTVAAGLKQLVRVSVDSGIYTPAHANRKFGITGHMTDSNGQEFDQTLWFRMKEN